MSAPRIFDFAFGYSTTGRLRKSETISNQRINVLGQDSVLVARKQSVESPRFSTTKHIGLGEHSGNYKVHHARVNVRFAHAPSDVRIGSNKTRAKEGMENSFWMPCGLYTTLRNPFGTGVLPFFLCTRTYNRQKKQQSARVLEHSILEPVFRCLTIRIPRQRGLRTS